MRHDPGREASTHILMFYYVIIQILARIGFFIFLIPMRAFLCP